MGGEYPITPNEGRGKLEKKNQKGRRIFIKLIICIRLSILKKESPSAKRLPSHPKSIRVPGMDVSDKVSDAQT
jgi:hypothetical protein